MMRLTQSGFWTAFSFGKFGVAAVSLERAPATTTDSSEKRLVCLEWMIAAVILGILSWPMLTGWVYIKDDLGRLHLPLRYLYAQSLKMGDNFTWLPNIFCGFYIHGEGQVGMYHPLHLLIYRVLSLTTAFNVEILLSYPFMLVGTFLFLRRWDIRRDGAMFGALSFTFSGFNLLHHVHPNMIAVVAHMPWLLLAIDVAIVDSNHRHIAGAKFAVSLLTVSQLLLGHPQMVVLSSIVEGLYLLFRAPSFELRRQLLSYGTAKVLGVLAASLQLLPTWDVVSHSYRAELPTEARFWWSLHPVNLVQFVAPYLFLTRVVGGNTHEFGLYNGAVTTVTILWLLIRFNDLGSKRFLVMGAFALGGLGLILAMGKHGYLYRIYAQLPVLSLFRVPARYILLLHFSMGIAGAVAFVDIANLINRGERVKWRKLWPLIVIPVASVSAAGFALWARAHSDSDFSMVHELAMRVASPGYVLIGPVLLILATVIFIASARGMRYALVGIILFAIVDQAIYGLSYMWSAPGPIDIVPFVHSQPMPPELTSHRVQFYDAYNNDDAYNNGPIMNGVYLGTGVAALLPEFRLGSMNHSRLRVAGVRYFQTRDMQWSEVERPLPRARLVSQAVISRFPNKDIDAIDVETTAVVAEPLHLAGGQPGAASIVSDRPGKIRLAASATSRQLLVLSESYHDGWKATVDGHSCSVLRVYGDFMGCVLEAGVHDVEFSFEPWSLRLGGWLSALGLGLMVISLLVSLSRRIN